MIADTSRPTLAAPGDPEGHGRDLRGAIDLAVLDFGGTLPTPPCILSPNDRRDATVARRIAHRLVRAGIRCVIGHFSATAALAAAAVYNAAGVLFLAPGTSHPELTRYADGSVFRVCGRDDVQARMITQALCAATNPGETIAVLAQPTTYGRSLAAYVEREINAAGRNARFQILDIRFDNVDGWSPDKPTTPVVVAGAAEFTAEVVTALRREGHRGELFLSDDCFGSNFLARAGRAAEGAYVTVLETPVDPVHIDRLTERFRRRDGRRPGAYFLTSYSAAAVLLHAVRTTGSCAPEVVARALRSQPWSTPLGTVSFDASGEIHGLSWTLRQILDGQFLPMLQVAALSLRT